MSFGTLKMLIELMFAENRKKISVLNRSVWVISKY